MMSGAGVIFFTAVSVALAVEHPEATLWGIAILTVRAIGRRS